MTALLDLSGFCHRAVARNAVISFAVRIAQHLAHQEAHIHQAIVFDGDRGIVQRAVNRRQDRARLHAPAPPDQT